jgi:acyl dehydratase
VTALDATIGVAGPWYQELQLGQVFDASPGLTLTAGHAALHQAILADRLRLALDAHLCEAVTGSGPLLAHPGLVCDVAIGQSTVATQRVVANLFYRGLALRRAPRIGDTLRTVTEVVALRDTTPREGRPATGLAVLRVRTVDQHERPVLDYHRCAMLPMREGTPRPGHADELDAISAELDPVVLRSSLEGFNLGRYRELVPGTHADALVPGARYELESGDTVSCAPELARMTLNIAAAHHDPAAGGRGRRLVYGGHTIGIALSHVTRALPNLVTVVGWRSCDHLAPVFEGDVLRSALTIEAVEPVEDSGGALVDIRVETVANRFDGAGSESVLDWRLVAAMAA